MADVSFLLQLIRTFLLSWRAFWLDNQDLCDDAGRLDGQKMKEIINQLEAFLEPDDNNVRSD